MPGRSYCCLALTANNDQGVAEMPIESFSWPNWLPHLLWMGHKCPYCNSVQFKPAELRSFDSLLSMFALRPVRCMFCWRRYYWFALKV
jgi:hypothetical protein